MSDHKTTLTCCTNADTEKRVKRIYKKSTSNRRSLARVDVSPPNIISIHERTVIGQEAPTKFPSTIRKNILDILSRRSSLALKTAEFSENERSEADGSEDTPVLADHETEELSKLRCPSECTEAIAEREKRRKQRCADYPGLAFGSSVFSSDTLMKFSVIRNELHNILKSQLKRAESEVTALNRRILSLEEDLGKSEKELNEATTELAEASLAVDQSEYRKIMSTDNSLIDEENFNVLESRLKAVHLLVENNAGKYEEAVDDFLKSLRCQK